MIAGMVLPLLACCQDRVPVAAGQGGAGAALEQAARRVGLVGDTGDPVGLYASETDRVCIVRAGDEYRIGATTEFADGQGCSANGAASGGERLTVRFGTSCRFEATFDGERIRFPSVLPAGCDRSCRGRATFAALSADRLSASIAEATSMHDRAGLRPCAD